MFVSGWTHNPISTSVSAQDFVIHALAWTYDADSGRFRWEQTVDVEAIAATAGTVVVLTPAGTEDDMILRAYDGSRFEAKPWQTGPRNGR